MKVKELIEKLQALPPDMMVIVDGYEGGVNETSDVAVETIALNVNQEWYYGAHDTVEEDEQDNYPGKERVQAVRVY